MGGIRRLRGSTGIGLSLACAGACAWLAGAGPALAQPPRTSRAVRYHGLSVRIPRSWPVFNLARDPHTCVRFNRHAVYLGTPGSEESCPAHSVGRTGAILISPLKASPRAPNATAAGLGLEGNVSSITARSAGVEVTATWARSQRLVAHALGRKSLPATSESGIRARGVAPPAGGTEAGTTGPIATVYTGRGFDACSAPSIRQMKAWSSSPDRAVGIYIGGPNEGCAQPNVSERWVSHELASGWHPFPIYVSLQAPRNGCGCGPMSANPRRAKVQGEAAASDAVTRARRFGIGIGNPIYDDMEGYTNSRANRRAVLAFLAGWTSSLHAAGYISGVYSGASSGVVDLAKKFHTGYPEPNDIWIADWNGRKTTSDPYVPRRDWRNHQRIHQYLGPRNETHGGVTLNVDNNYLDAATLATKPLPGG
ncbi:MAG: DUF1906 domain-containing protein [Solirubrobacterales bacterium]|nr:DUF1906 domain-containing protein [Solirubrobacterales bacterium]